MRILTLVRLFMINSIQQDLAYRANFWIHGFHSLLNLAVGVLGMSILFNQVQTLRGWNYASALALLGVYLIIGALRSLVIGPGLEALAGMGQEIVTGNFDFTLLRPLNTQFLISFRYWRLFALFDLALGSGVIACAVTQSGHTLSMLQLVTFLVTLAAAVTILYSVLLAFTALVFWNPAMLFTWVFDALFQLARYPVQIYPDWLRFLLTWIIPVGLMTTIPAQALNGQVSFEWIAGSVLSALVLLGLSSWFFTQAMRRYTSASS